MTLFVVNSGERRPWRGILLYGVRPTVANHQQLKEGIPYFVSPRFVKVCLQNSISSDHSFAAAWDGEDISGEGACSRGRCNDFIR